MSNTTCCIFNLAAIYRAPIFRRIDKELHCDFYIGDRVAYSLELMDYTELKGFRKKLKYVPILKNFYWQKGAVSLAFKPYKAYIITGEAYCLSTWILLAISKISGKKTYLWTHGWYGRETKLKRASKKIFFSLASRVLLYGDFARNLMIGEGFNPDKLVTIYNSLDYDNQVAIRKNQGNSDVYQKHFGNPDPVMLYIGRVQTIKKLDQLIGVFDLLTRKNVRCNLMIIGGGEDETRLRELVTSLNLNSRVWFFGSCYDETVLGDLIYNASVCISPGNVGLTALHCLVYGTPVITHNNFPNQMPEFESVKPGITGDFYDEDSVQDLGDKIIFWLDKTKTDRNSIRQNCFELMKSRYNPDFQVNVLKEVFRTDKVSFEKPGQAMKVAGTERKNDLK